MQSILCTLTDCFRALFSLSWMLCLLASTGRQVQARLLQQDSPALAANVTSVNATNLRPSTTTQVYTGQDFAGNTSYAFLPGYTANVTGDLGTVSYNVQLVNSSSSGRNLSAWHDIPLDLQTSPDGSVTINTMVEIPTGEQAKYETQTGKPGNPIQQDTNEVLDAQGNVTGEVPRYYLYGPTLGNYGGLPQTWSNSNKTDSITGFVGDNDPLDVLDISSIRAPLGGVYRVKVLGALGMIDANETDWKVMVINTKDPQANNYTDISDVPRERLSDILQFYANYKTAEGKPATCFWPATKGARAPVCQVPADVDPAEYFHHQGHTVEIIRYYQDNYAWLISGACGSDACAELWPTGWPVKEEESEDEGSPASAG